MNINERVEEQLLREARRLYESHHGHKERAEDFAREIVERAHVFDEVRKWMITPKDSESAQRARKQRRTDLDSISLAARKLRHLLARTDVRCRFPMNDGTVISYPLILDQLERQVVAERLALEQHNNRGRPRHDIAVTAAELRAGCLDYQMPPECVANFLKIIDPDADLKTVRARKE